MCCTRSVVSNTQAHRPCGVFLERVEEHALAVFVIAIGLGQKCLVVEHFFIQRPGISARPRVA
jgi:hypothetical protein